jgi:hypothetical protein
MESEQPSVSVIAGQLSYLFDDEPGLRTATDDELAVRLNHDDRYARARAKYPLDSDAELSENRIAEFDDRITAALVREARGQLPD